MKQTQEQKEKRFYLLCIKTGSYPRYAVLGATRQFSAARPPCASVAKTFEAESIHYVKRGWTESERVRAPVHQHHPKGMI